jgi:molecular chaperone GrpE
MAGRDWSSREEGAEQRSFRAAMGDRGPWGERGVTGWGTGHKDAPGPDDPAEPDDRGAPTGGVATDGDVDEGHEQTPADASPAEDPLKVALAQRDEYLDSLRRLQAEFENYRKRVTSQQADQAARATALIVDKLLPVLDTLDLAVRHLADADSADAKALVASGNQLHAVLAKEGLERIDPLGEVFDPNDHEAVGHVPADDEEPADDDAPVPKPVVAEVMRPGYRWKGAVLRPAMVTVRG